MWALAIRGQLLFSRCRRWRIFDRSSALVNLREKEQMSVGSSAVHKPCGRRLLSGDVDAVAIAGAGAGP